MIKLSENNLTLVASTKSGNGLTSALISDAAERVLGGGKNVLFISPEDKVGNLNERLLSHNRMDELKQIADHGHVHLSFMHLDVEGIDNLIHNIAKYMRNHPHTTTIYIDRVFMFSSDRNERNTLELLRSIGEISGVNFIVSINVRRSEYLQSSSIPDTTRAQLSDIRTLSEQLNSNAYIVTLNKSQNSTILWNPKTCDFDERNTKPLLVNMPFTIDTNTQMVTMKGGVSEITFDAIDTIYARMEEIRNKA